MKKVRFGVIGLGNMGSAHSRWIHESNSRDMALGAVCDIVEEKAKKFGQQYDVPWFLDAEEMMDSGQIDAILIAVPHYWHAPQAIMAARKGLHVLCEKPLSSSVGAARQMIAECDKHGVKFGAMLQQRTRAIMKKMKQMVERGDLGEIFRVQMVCSNWFRTQAYYNSGDWRGTWDGEGGGVLINQAPHSLDLFQWIGGMPKSVMGMVATRDHDIEVEDTANFLCDYGDGKVGYLYATTAELPGYEEFRVSGDKGTLVSAGGELRFGKLKTPLHKYTHTTKSTMGASKDQKISWRTVPIGKSKGSHLEVTKAFAAWITRGKKPVATAAEAINELELSNAMYLAGFKNKTVELPVDAAEMERLLTKLEKDRSTGKGGNMRKEATKVLSKLTRKSESKKKSKTRKKSKAAGKKTKAKKAKKGGKKKSKK